MNRLIENEMENQERIKQLEQQIRDFKADKRSKPYKDLKQELKALKPAEKGVGDKVEEVLEKTGIAKIAKTVLGDDCGCDARKEKLNKIFNKTKLNCLEHEDYIRLDDYFKQNKGTVSSQEQKMLRDIYLKVFNVKKPATSCGPCVRKIVRELKTVYNNY